MDQATRKTYFKLSALLFIFQGISAALGFTVAYLQGEGMSATQSGIVMSFGSIVMMFAPPLWGILADKLRSIRKVMIITLAVSTVLYCLTPAASALSHCSVLVMSCVLTSAAFFRAPVGSLIDNWAVNTVRRTEGLNYGHIRLWGSIGYAIISLGLTWAVSKLSLASSFAFYALSAIATLLVCFRLPDPAAEKPVVNKGKEKLQLGRLLKNYWLTTFILFLTLRGMSLYCSNNFMSYLLTDVGTETSVLGAINAFRAMFEVPMLILSPKLIKKFGMIKLLVVSSLLYLLGDIGYALCSDLWHILVIQAASGIAYGLFVSCQVQYVAVVAPPDLSATAQTLAAAIPAVTGIFGNALAGWIMDNIGIRQYYYFSAGALFLGCLLLIVSFPIGTKLLKLKKPNTRLGT